MAKITLLPEIETKSVANARPLMVNVKSRDMLYSCYMPNLINAGLFVQAASFGPNGASSLPPPGSRIMMLLTLPDDPQRNTVTGKVCWMSFVQTSLGAQAGVGVHFDENDANKLVRDKIEKMLAGILGKSETRTMTV
jgi:type IV pilus assembly protein PilZ